MSLSLDTRVGLPEALRVLLAEYPREGWAADPGFRGLVEFWLDRHMMFRRLSELLAEGATDVADEGGDPMRLRAGIARHGGMLVNQLHGHHQIEDHHYFPVLTERDPRLVQGFEILDADHQALDGHLAAFVEGANAAIGALPGADPASAADRFRAANAGLARLLDRHLTDEEELIVPVILKYGHRGLPG